MAYDKCVDFYHESDHGQPEEIVLAFDDAAEINSDYDMVEMDFIVPPNAADG
jgi:hypothetical protein